MITSLANEKVRYARALLRRRARLREGRCLIEGLRLIDEALRAGSIPALVFCTPETLADARGAALYERCRALGAAAYEASAEVVASLSDTVTPQGIVAVVPFPSPSSASAPGLTLVVDGLRDPGNLGTLLRSAAASGAERVLLGPGTVDPYSPKVLRSAMGAHFRLPPEVASWAGVAEALRGRPVWLADARGEARYDLVDWTEPCGLIIGGEAEGASPQAASLATGRVAIPLARGVESLNAAVAASVILFEAARQRWAAGVSCH